ncbi:MAG: ADP-glyceromanno-heptose 6-epimerase, partial [Saprospiraceae bacterium]
MIIITGAAGFIGSCMTAFLNNAAYTNLILVDDFSIENKRRNWEDKQYVQKFQRDIFLKKIKKLQEIQAIIHLGARTNTTEKDQKLLNRLNLDYSKELWKYCTEKQIPFLYASSAATYGNGSLGFDDKTHPEELFPLNLYGHSKNDFDEWALEQGTTPPYWYGFKFFNVYGPNEYHKSRMASVIFHCFKQIKETNAMKLFRSHNPDFKDGQQMRDFIYVEDVIKILYHFLKEKPKNGIYNLGTGKARTFQDLAIGVFNALGIETNISFIDTPIDIRDKYQYFTEADTKKLISAIGHYDFTSLENGINNYVNH